MIALDTNVIVRLLTGDDPKQQKRAKDTLKQQCSADNPAWINRIVACETVWVLHRSYGYGREFISGALERLLYTAEIEFEDRHAIQSALQLYRQGADFADAVIANTSADAGAESIVTFDLAASKRLPMFKAI